MKKYLMIASTLMFLAPPAFAQDFDQPEAWQSEDQVLDENMLDQDTFLTFEEMIALENSVDADKAPPRRRPPFYICAARNLRGMVFRAQGPNRGNVQQRAMNQCRRQSAVCRPMGCRVVYRW